MSEILKKINSRGYKHTFEMSAELSADKSTINEEERTVELCFSSESLIERWYGYF